MTKTERHSNLDDDERGDAQRIARIGSYLVRKIQEYRHAHPEYAHLSDDEILELIAEE